MQSQELKCGVRLAWGVARNGMETWKKETGSRKNLSLAGPETTRLMSINTPVLSKEDTGVCMVYLLA